MLKDLSKDEVLNMINLETAEIKEIADYFSHVVNNFSFNPKKIAMEQEKSKQMKDLDIYWIKTLSSYTYRTDLRNEASARVGRQLAEIPFVKGKIELVDNQKMQKVAEKMEMDHRTLQQSFSRLVLYHFLQTCNQKESQTLIKVMGDSFYRLPLI